jgi:hypothetical protein
MYSKKCKYGQAVATLFKPKIDAKKALEMKKKI